MELRQYYLDNVKEDEYYHTFYDRIKNVNMIYNVFYGVSETENFKFEIYDEEEAIEQFRLLCMPENENHNKEEECRFYVLLFYLYRHGYYIEQFPRLIEHPPKNSYDFVNREIRNKLLILEEDDNGTVRHATRRKYVAQLSFQKKDTHIELGESIAQKIKTISNRDASFESMSVDEKLAEIDNAIEFLLKDGNKFLQLDYAPICFSFVTNQLVKEYRKKLQCFRHASTDSITERSNFTDEQKQFLIDYGITVLKAIDALKSRYNL